MKVNKLTNKQLRFCQEYIVDSNATAAYIRAGYSPNLANTAAFKLLQNSAIASKIESLQEKIAKKTEYTIETHLNSNKKMIELYDLLLDLSLKTSLNTEEQGQFTRLMMVLRASDANKAKEITNKMLGWNKEPDEDLNDSKNLNIKINIVKSNGNQS